MMIDRTRKCEVLIAGAGPVGMSLGLALVRAGVETIVLEKLPELSREARASTIHPPTLEFFDRIGIAQEVLASGRQIKNLQFWERKNRELVADFSYSLIAGDTAFPCRLQCPQSTVTRIILPHIAGAANGKVLFEHEFASLSQNGAGVSVDVRTADGEASINAKYVVGCDGALSQVRESLGLGFTGKTYEDRFLLVSSDIDLSSYFPEMGTVAYIFDPEEWVIVMTLPDAVRIVFRLRPEENAEFAKQEENVRTRIVNFVGENVEYSIKSISTYHVHQRVTETFRVDRVLLAGDAAHINNPTGGMGMNSGIHDARDLAAALIGVLRNGAEENVLDDYATRRKQTATDMVQAMTDQNYKHLAEANKNERFKRNRELREAANDIKKAREYLLKTAMLAERI
jgi:3-(3-hydroxy-phenyl)propionate hydroxylase